MKKIILATVLAGIGSTAALAADLAARTYTKAPPTMAAVSNWTGWYVGLNAGGAWGHADVSSSVVNGPSGFFDDVNVPAVNAIGQNQLPLKPTGATAGGQVGYNWQFSNVVAGLEADLQYFRQSASTRVTGIYPASAPGVTFTFSSSVSANWLFTFRPRVGVLIAPNFLLYATGGLAVSELKANFAFEDTTSSDTPSTATKESGALSKTKAGWVVGAGGEYALSSGWSVKAEYLRVDLGRESVTSKNLVFDGIQFPDSVFTHRVDLKSNIVRAGVNYHFN
jgi:outer membrane immunogenic protein